MDLPLFGMDVQILQSAAWLIVSPVSDSQLLSEIGQELDLGEAQAIALAVEKQADLVLMDEEKGRAIAQRLNLTVTGVLGILLDAKQQGIIPEVKPLLHRLRSIKFY